MPEIRVNDQIMVPEAAVETKSVRASGPGRQNVNKLATKARNREDCARKAAELLRAALFRPKVRRRTRPTHASKQRRIEAKRHQSDRLRNRAIED